MSKASDYKSLTRNSIKDLAEKKKLDQIKCDLFHIFCSILLQEVNRIPDDKLKQIAETGEVDAGLKLIIDIDEKEGY